MALNHPIDRAGTFKARIREYALKEYQSGAVGLYMVFDIEAQWDGEAWVDWTAYQVDADGTVWIIKRDGTLNNKSVEALVALGWDANLESFAHGACELSPCQIVVRPEEYEGNTTYRVAFINPYDASPGVQGGIAPDKAKELQSRYGSALRAIAGNAKANGTKPTGKPAGPPKPKLPDFQVDENEVPF